MKRKLCLFVSTFLIMSYASGQNLFLYNSAFPTGVAAGHDHEIELTSMEFNISRKVVTGPPNTTISQPSHSDIVLSKSFEDFSPKLMLAATNGAASDGYEIRKYSGATLALKIELKGAVLLQYSVSSDGGCCPSESVTVNYTKIKVTNFVPNPATVYMWDRVNNTATF